MNLVFCSVARHSKTRPSSCFALLQDIAKHDLVTERFATLPANQLASVHFLTAHFSAHSNANVRQRVCNFGAFLVRAMPCDKWLGVGRFFSFLRILETKKTSRLVSDIPCYWKGSVVDLGDEKKPVVFVLSLNWSFFFVPKDLGDEKN